MRQNRPYAYLTTVQGMCRQCRTLVPCRVVTAGGAVYQERLCPSCGPSRARIADSLPWYTRVTQMGVRPKPHRGLLRPVQHGCPHDCGPCSLHAGACHLPVFSVTNQCNMACPICFTYNRTDPAWFMPRDELRRLLDRVIDRAAPLDLVNVTGGEPALHPEIAALLEECRRPGIGRVTMNSNGLRMAGDADFCRRLAELGVYVILSFHTLEAGRSLLIHGRNVVDAKLRALENLQAAGVGVTLLYVMIRGLNDDEIGRIIDLAGRFDVVRSVTVQTMTYTGQGGKDFGPRRHMPLDAAAAAIQTATAGRMRAEHFFPHPGAHPLCYSVAYYLKCDAGPRSFTEFFSVDELRDMLAGGYLLQPSDRNQEAFKAALDRLWAGGGNDDLVRRFRILFKRLYPSGQTLTRFERQRLAEQDVLSVYLHAHMDEDTLDLGRLICCPDQVPDADGRMIPACAYNLFYRMRDERFSHGDIMAHTQCRGSIMDVCNESWSRNRLPGEGYGDEGG